MTRALTAFATLTVMAIVAGAVLIAAFKYLSGFGIIITMIVIGGAADQMYKRVYELEQLKCKSADKVCCQAMTPECIKCREEQK